MLLVVNYSFSLSSITSISDGLNDVSHIMHFIVTYLLLSLFDRWEVSTFITFRQLTTNKKPDPRQERVSRRYSAHWTPIIFDTGMRSVPNGPSIMTHIDCTLISFMTPLCKMISPLSQDFTNVRHFLLYAT